MLGYERGSYTMKYSASQAAKATGKSIPTITRAIKKGTISATKVDGGGYEIEPAELHRVFPALTPVSDTKGHLLGRETPSLPPENNNLERLVETLQEQIADLRQDRDAWKVEAGRWQEQAAHSLRLLEPPALEQPTAGQEKPVGGFWARLTGRTPANG